MRRLLDYSIGVHSAHFEPPSHLGDFFIPSPLGGSPFYENPNPLFPPSRRIICCFDYGLGARLDRFRFFPLRVLADCFAVFFLFSLDFTRNGAVKFRCFLLFPEWQLTWRTPEPAPIFSLPPISFFRCRLPPPQPVRPSPRFFLSRTRSDDSPPSLFSYSPCVVVSLTASRLFSLGSR